MWLQITLFVISMVISYVTAPKAQSQPPAGLGDFEVPTAEVGREIPVLFGTRDIGGANVVWYGDLKVVSVRV